MRLIRIAACALVLALLATLPAQAGKRVALVMGNSAYTNAPALPNPRNDAEDMATTLEKLGFEVIRGMDLDREGMEDAVDQFGAAAEGADLALVFYAGHGIQVAGENYALPIDAQLRSERDLRRAVPLSWLVDEAGRAAQLGLVILDACRNNPLAEEMKRGLGATRAFVVGRGLARLEDAPTNTLIAYATSADATADDGSGRNSPYTRALLQHIPTAGLEIRQLFGRVRDSVIDTTNGGQTPFTYGSLGGDAIYLALPLTTVALTTGPGQSQEDEKYVTPAGRQMVEIEFWRTIKDSTDWRDFQAYLDQFGENATFSVLARLRRDKLRGTGDTDIDTAISATPAPGTPHAEYPNVVWNAEGMLEPAAGYRWASGDEDSMDVTPIISGTPHDTYPNVVWDADGKLEPAPGYEWASDDPDNYDVVPSVASASGDTTTTTDATDTSGTPAAGTAHETYPNVVWDAEGMPQPEAGYQWASNDPDSYDVEPVVAGTPHFKYPNVVWDADGLLEPAPGYEWSSDDPSDFTVLPEAGSEVVTVPGDDTGTPPAGTPHETFPNVVWDADGMLEPAPGYDWASDDPDDLTVVPSTGSEVATVPDGETGTPPAGTPHETFPNVVWDAEGMLQPAPGYDWASDDPDDYTVRPSTSSESSPLAGTPHETYPNVVWNDEGLLDPAPGYAWASEDPDIYDVVRVIPGTPHATYPNVVWDETGQLQPATGHQWVSDDSDNYEVQAVYPGAPHYKYPNVVWDAEGMLQPAPGYIWVTDDPDNYDVVPESGAAQPSTGGLLADVQPLKGQGATGGTQLGAVPIVPPQPATGVRTVESFRDCAQCPEMVVVPAGTFTMGSPADEALRDEDEGPQRQVTIPAAFAVGKFEVTFAEWDACVADGGCDGYQPDDEGWGRGDRPVINVGWNRAQAYLRWLSGKTGQRYRLLTEAEWEFAARGGTATARYWGNQDGVQQATCNDCGNAWDGKSTAPVGTFAPNAYGLHDMLGNVWEWVEDCYHESYAGGPANSSAWVESGCSNRVLRGGSWDVGQWFARAAERFAYSSGGNYGADDDGFRVARDL